MIRHIKRADIDLQKWDDCILNSASPQIFGCSYYLDICCPNWSAFVLNDYEAVFPIEIKKKYFINYTTQPYFVRHFGIYTNKVDIAIEPWLDALTKQASYIAISTFNSTIEQLNNFQLAEKIYQSINLNKNHETLRSNYSVSHIRKLKKINPLETSLVDITDYSIYIHEFKNTVSEKKLNYSDSHLTTLLKLMNELPKHCKVISKGVVINEEIVAGAYFVQYQKRILYLKGFRKLNAANEGGMFLLFDNIIKENCEHDTILDFGGSNDSNVRQFFKGFGAEDSVYLHLKKNELPQLVRWLKK